MSTSNPVSQTGRYGGGISILNTEYQSVRYTICSTPLLTNRKIFLKICKPYLTLPKTMKHLIKKILQDIKVGVGSEFDRNFEREAFFSRKWARRKSPIGKHLLINRGHLRRSISGKVGPNNVSFSSSLPHAAIHNEGGEITVTPKMKRYFWAKYLEASGGMGRTKKGALRQNSKNRRLSQEAEFWKAMALMRVGKKIKIPQRQFIGNSPEVENLVEDIIKDTIKGYLETLPEKLKKL